MPGFVAHPHTAVEAGLLALATAAVALLAVIGYRYWRDSRITAEQRERRRREMLVARGKIVDANIVDYREDVIFFAYSVRGMEYTASQDVSSLKDHVPPDLTFLLPVAAKYLPANPANSIVVAEHWTGLRQLKL